MAKSNHGRVNDALELLNRGGLRPFVEPSVPISEKWIQQRMMGQKTRNKFTDYWKGHEIKGDDDER